MRFSHHVFGLHCHNLSVYREKGDGATKRDVSGSRALCMAYMPGHNICIAEFGEEQRWNLKVATKGAEKEKEVKE